ncbi:MAG: hypothetical protein U1F42_08350 [Candidatus Competibacteraceae bacterium]
MRWREGQTVRQLHEKLTDGLSDRRTFEQLLEAMAGVGLVEIQDDAFSKDRKVIAFRRLYLTDAGRTAGISEVGMVRLREAVAGTVSGRKRRARKGR